MSATWQNEDAVALRAFLRRVPEHKLKELMDARCPAILTREDLEKLSPDAIARITAMKTGWDSYQAELLKLATFSQTAGPTPDFASMS